MAVVVALATARCVRGHLFTQKQGVATHLLKWFLCRSLTASVVLGTPEIRLAMEGTVGAAAATGGAVDATAEKHRASAGRLNAVKLLVHAFASILTTI